MSHEVVLEITDLARGGAGVGREGSGRIIFVPYTAPGDRVRVRIEEEKKHYAQGTLLEILDASKVRQKAPCPAFGKCGGCQWQHLPYPLQWETKLKGVRHALGRVQVAAPDIFDEMPAERVWEYRNRVQIRGFGSELGFFKAGSNDLVPVDRCDIARPEINQVWDEIRDEGSRFGKAYKVEVEWTSEGDIRKTWNRRHSAGGFRQVHDDQNEKLKKWVGEVVGHATVLYDLFGGAGNLSIPLVNKADEIHCVDQCVPSVRPSGLPNHFYFHKSSVLKWVLGQTQGNDGSVAILDPPREGLGPEFSEIAAAMERLGVCRIVAVGCDPDSWARDVSRWVKRGSGSVWELQKVGVIDLFPQTFHVESIAVLVRR